MPTWKSVAFISKLELSVIAGDLYKKIRTHLDP